MKVLHLVPLVSDNAEYGGPVRGTVRQCIALRERGIQSEILGLARVSGEVPDSVMGVDAKLFPFRKLLGHRFATAISLAALSWLRQNIDKFDCIHVHAGRDLWILLAVRIANRAKVPIVWQTHGMLAPRDGAILRLYDLLLTKPAISKSKSMLYLTPYEERDLVKVGTPSSTVHIVNGVDGIAREFEISTTPRNPLKLVFISRIHPRKRLEDLIEAVAELRDKGRHAHLDIFGPDEGALEPALALIGRLDLGNLVQYRGALAYSEVRPILSNYDVMVLPSVSEPFPNIVLESLANGTPVVATSSCGLAPYLREVDAGLVVEPGRAALSAGLIELFDNPNSLADYARNGLKLAEDRFTMASVAKELEKVYGGVQ